MSMWGAALILYSFVAAVPSVPGSSTSATPEAAAFAEGQRRLQQGDARGAEREWKAGYGVAHDPAFLVPIAEAEEKAGAPAEALQTYERYLRESPNASDREDIEARVERLGAHRPNVAPSPSGPEVPAEFGASAPAPTSTTPQSPSPGATPGPSRQALDDGDPSGDDLRALADDQRPRSKLNVAAWVGTGVTVALLGAAAFFGAAASEKEGDLNRLSSYHDPKTSLPLEYASVATQFEDDMRIGRRDNKIAKVFLGSAAIAAVGTAILFVIDGVRAPADVESVPVRHAERQRHLTNWSAGLGAGTFRLGWSFP